MRHFLLSNIPSKERSKSNHVKSTSYNYGPGLFATRPPNREFDFGFKVGILSSRHSNDNLLSIFLGENNAKPSELRPLNKTIKVNSVNVNLDFSVNVNFQLKMNWKYVNAMIIDCSAAGTTDLRFREIKDICQEIRKNTQDGTNIILAYTFRKGDNLNAEALKSIEKEMSDCSKKFALDATLLIAEDSTSVSQLFVEVAKLLLDRLEPDDDQKLATDTLAKRGNHSNQGCRLI